MPQQKNQESEGKSHKIGKSKGLLNTAQFNYNLVFKMYVEIIK